MMPTKLGSGICTYCLERVDELTEDHVFPASWYPDATPQNMEKPKAPACRPCNNVRYSRIEADVREAFVLAYGKDDERVAGIQEAAARGIDPDTGKTERERRARAARGRKLYRSIAALSATKDPPPNSFLIPGFGEDQVDPETRLRVGVNAGDFHDLMEKIVRGMTFVETGHVVGHEYELETHLAKPENIAAFHERALNPVTTRVGPAFEFTSTREPERDPIAGAFLFTIWGRLNVVGLILPKVTNPEPRSLP